MEKDNDRQTVLIVDDEPFIRMYIRRVLEDAGHLAREASTAHDALRLLEDDAVTMLVTDIDIPGAMNGLALAREVQSRWPNIAVIVTSGQLPTPGEMPIGTRFLPKPVSPEQLIEAVKPTSSVRNGPPQD